MSLWKTSIHRQTQNSKSTPITLVPAHSLTKLPKPRQKTHTDANTNNYTRTQIGIHLHLHRAQKNTFRQKNNNYSKTNTPLRLDKYKKKLNGTHRNTHSKKYLDSTHRRINLQKYKHKQASEKFLHGQTKTQNSQPEKSYNTLTDTYRKRHG